MNDQAKRRILFVDDEPMVLKGLQRTFRKMRDVWEMMFTSSSKEALALLDSETFDVIVSDLRMPETRASHGPGQGQGHVVITERLRRRSLKSQHRRLIPPRAT